MALADYIENHHGLLHSDKDRPWCSNWPAIRKKVKFLGNFWCNLPWTPIHWGQRMVQCAPSQHLNFYSTGVCWKVWTFFKRIDFWATSCAGCLEHQYIGGRGWCKWFCTITALKLLLNWGVLESRNFFQKNIISSTTNIEHRQHHTREIDNINHWWCVWFRISAKILIMWWWIWTSVTLACVEERKCGTYVKFLQVSEPKSWPN